MTINADKIIIRLFFSQSNCIWPLDNQCENCYLFDRQELERFMVNGV